MLGITTTNARVGGFRGGISAEAKTIYNRIIADGGVSNLTRLNFFVKGLKTIYGDLANVPVCYDAHWIGYKLGSGTGATSGQAAAKLYSLTVAGDAVQTTAASQPLLLSHNGDNYWYGSGVSGNYVSTPNAAANQITGDIEIILKDISFKILSGSGYFGLVSKFYANLGYMFEYNQISGILAFYKDTLSANSTVTLASVGITTNTKYWIKVSRVVSTGAVNFYYSTNSGVTYNQIGATVILGAGQNIGIYNNPLYIGCYTPVLENFNGSIGGATISNSIGGTPVVDFNPSQYNASTSQTQWTSSTGEVWTINTGTATTGYKGQLVSKTIVQSDGVDDSIKNTPFVTSANCTDYIAFEQFGWVNGDFIIDGAVVNSIGLQQTTLIPNIRFEGAGGGVGVSNFIVNTLSLATILGTATPGSVNLFRNNTSLLFGGTKADSQGYTLFARGNSTSFSNASINTVIKALGQDDVTIRTATYNFIKSLNNNAF
jgi:hypothetical protein